MSEELQQRTESLRKMVETRDCVIAALESMLATAPKPEDKAWASAIDRNPRTKGHATRNETMNATEQLHAYRERTESLRRMVETRDLIIKDLEREIRELKAMLHGTTL